jgi:hypothetical protein
MKPKPSMLLNVAEIARQYPDECEAESPDKIRALRKGDAVELCDLRQIFWVRIESRNGDVFTGRVDTMFDRVGQFDYGDRIEFHACNIYYIF